MTSFQSFCSGFFADVTLKEDDIATVWLKNKVPTADGEFRMETGGLIAVALVFRQRDGRPGSITTRA